MKDQCKVNASIEWLRNRIVDVPVDSGSTFLEHTDRRVAWETLIGEFKANHDTSEGWAYIRDHGAGMGATFEVRAMDLGEVHTKSGYVHLPKCWVYLWVTMRDDGLIGSGSILWHWPFGSVARAKEWARERGFAFRE